MAKERPWAICSGRSPKMSKWANCSFFERITHSLIFSQKTSNSHRKSMSGFLILVPGWWFGVLWNSQILKHPFRQVAFILFIIFFKSFWCVVRHRIEWIPYRKQQRRRLFFVLSVSSSSYAAFMYATWFLTTFLSFDRCLIESPLCQLFDYFLLIRCVSVVCSSLNCAAMPT